MQKKDLFPENLRINTNNDDIMNLSSISEKNV